MAPFLTARMEGSTFRIMRTVPKKFVSNCQCISSMEHSSTAPRRQ